MKNNKIFKKGGAKSRYPDKKGFQAVYDMLASPSSTLSILTTSSLKGFMLKLDVIEEEAAYKTDNNTPITSYILKFVVISNGNRVERLENYNNKTKESEKHDDFIEEAKLQQSIWMSSIQQIQHEICPSVANLAIFDNNGARILLDDLFNMYDLPELKELTDLFTYLYRQLTGTRGLGILTMPNIVGSQTLYRFYNIPGISNAVKIDVKAQLAAQVIILFLYLCVIHFDLHSSNSLVFLNPTTNNYETRIIDFGRVSDICEFKKNDYINKDRKPVINNQLDSYFKELKLHIIDDDQKRKFVKKVLDYIYKFDLDRHGGTAQMKWIDEIKNNPNNCLKVFQQLDDIIFSGKPKSFTPEKIQKYTNIGVIQNLSNSDNYVQKTNLYVSAPDDFASYHSSQNSDYFSQSQNSQIIALPVEEEASQQSEIIALPSRSSSQIMRTPTLKFGLVAPAELPVTPELASTVGSTVASSLPTTVASSLPTTVASSLPTTVASTVASTVETFPIPSNNLPTSSQENPFLTNNTFSITSNPNLSFLSQPFKSESGPYTKKYRTGEKGGKRSKKRSKKGKKRITKKKRHSSK
jgi:hypothetical protein